MSHVPLDVEATHESGFIRTIFLPFWFFCKNSVFKVIPLLSIKILKVGWMVNCYETIQSGQVPLRRRCKTQERSVYLMHILYVTLPSVIL